MDNTTEDLVHRDGFDRRLERLKYKTKDKRKPRGKKIHKVESDLRDEDDEFDPQSIIKEYNAQR